MEDPQKFPRCRLTPNGNGGAKSATIRLLCHKNTAGGVIGHSGYFVKQLVCMTGAKIEFDKTNHKYAERVISVTGDTQKDRAIILGGEKWEISQLQEGLVRVFERVLEVEENGSENVRCRLLAGPGQAARVIGSKGNVISNLQKRFATKIFIPPMNQSPDCASPGEELIQIMGKAVAVKQTLLVVAWILQETKPRERILKCTSSAENCRALKLSIDTLPKVVTFRLLCSHKAAGALIGWGGSKVKSLEKSTEASIKISKPVATHMERIVTISAWECSEALFSPAQIALTLTFSRSVEIDNDIEPGSSLGTGTTISAQLLVDSNQVSFLIDTKGMISSDIRTATGVEMQLSWGSSITSSDGKSDNILQISGLYESVLNALFLVTRRLRNLIFSTIVSDEAKKVQNCCSSYSNVNSYNRENTVSRGSEDLRALSPINHDMTLIQAMDRLGLLHNTVEGCIETSMTDTTGGFASTKSGIKKGSVEFDVSANSREEIEVPEHILSCVHGESGSNLARIKQISGASIAVADPCAGKSCRKVIISGTVYSIQVARSLLQAFILPEF